MNFRWSGLVCLMEVFFHLPGLAAEKIGQKDMGGWEKGGLQPDR